jgi:hypothetical protein
MSIKLFEEFTNNELYKKVSFDEWREKAYDDYPEYENLSKIEKTWIINKIRPTKGGSIDIKWDVTWTRGEIKTKIKYDPLYNLYISKTSDDWFILEYRRLNVGEMGESIADYYICDQFDGLKEFFKDVMDIQ